MILLPRPAHRQLAGHPLAAEHGGHHRGIVEADALPPGQNVIHIGKVARLHRGGPLPVIGQVLHHIIKYRRDLLPLRLHPPGELLRQSRCGGIGREGNKLAALAEGGGGVAQRQGQGAVENRRIPVLPHVFQDPEGILPVPLGEGELLPVPVGIEVIIVIRSVRLGELELDPLLPLPGVSDPDHTVLQAGKVRLGVVVCVGVRGGGAGGQKGEQGQSRQYPLVSHAAPPSPFSILYIRSGVGRKMGREGDKRADIFRPYISLSKSTKKSSKLT